MRRIIEQFGGLKPGANPSHFDGGRVRATFKIFKIITMLAPDLNRQNIPTMLRLSIELNL